MAKRGKPSNSGGFLQGVIENRSEWHKRAWSREENAMGRCLWWVLSLGFDCAHAFQASEVTVAARFFPNLSQWRFFSSPHHHRTINIRFDTPIKISKFSFFEKSVMRAWKKSLMIAREERLGKNLARPSGEERKTFKFRRFSSGRHEERVRMTRESLIARRKCNGKVSLMSLEPWFRLRACISSVWSDRRSKVFS